MAEPYRSTGIFDQDTLPAALRREHSTKEGAWGLIRVLEGKLRLDYADGTPPRIVTRHEAGLVRRGLDHYVEPLGPMRRKAEFYSEEPAFKRGGWIA